MGYGLRHRESGLVMGHHTKIVIEETLHHGETHMVRRVEVWKITPLTVKGILLSCIYPMDVEDHKVAHMMKQLEAMGCSSMGWADYRIVSDPDRTKPVFKHWNEVLFPPVIRTDAVKAARRELGLDPDGGGQE